MDSRCQLPAHTHLLHCPIPLFTCALRTGFICGYETSLRALDPVSFTWAFLHQDASLINDVRLNGNDSVDDRVLRALAAQSTAERLP